MTDIDPVQTDLPAPPQPQPQPQTPTPTPTPTPIQAPAKHPALPRGALGAWWWQGLRTALLMRPRWAGLQVTPQLVALMLLVGYAADVGVTRLAIDGPANFYWASLVTSNWFSTAVTLWVCWLVTQSASAEAPEPTAQAGAVPAEGEASAKPGMSAVFAMLVAQGFMFILISGLVMVPIYRDEDMTDALRGHWQAWLVWGVPMAWYVLAQIRLLWLAGPARWGIRLRAAVLIVSCVAAQVMLRPPQHWYPAPAQQEADDGATPPPLKLTQELLEAQPRLLESRLQALKADAGGHPLKGPHQTGAASPRMFAITFAPYAEADVFAHESQVVADLMQSRFQTTGRTMQLVNNRDTVGKWPWATPLNLQRTIRRMAQLMDRSSDVLFIHLTSHGARNGQLAAEFDPLDIDPVTPQALKQWLDDAGIKWRVISISACFSGSWIPLLADDNTLVMTAADADHTSYGCGRRSPLTFFGRAMYEEQLRQTLSFEQAHAAARKVIEQREIEAGKDDGYSNPQIKVGEAVRRKLAELTAGLLGRH